MIFESHAHYDDARYDADREELLASLPAKNVGTIINVGADMVSTEASVSLAERYPYIYAAVGIHPDEVTDLSEEDMQRLTALSSHEKVVAIGEIGLDYFRKEGDSYKEVQAKWFRRQLAIAAEAKLPVIIHSRDAAEDTMAILREYRSANPQIDSPGVVHCYSYSPEMAMEYVKMGFYIGIGGVVTFKNAKKLVETAALLPLDRILVETDCPYLSPEPHRGERNDSSNIRFVIDKIAAIRGIDPEEVEAQTERNAKKMYRILDKS